MSRSMFARHAQRQAGVPLEIGALSEGGPDRGHGARCRGLGFSGMWEPRVQPNLAERPRGEQSVPLDCDKKAGRSPGMAPAAHTGPSEG